MLTFSYVELLVLQAVAGLILLGVYLIRKRWTPPPTRLQSLLGGAHPRLPPEVVDYLVPLLVFENRYPGFSNILGVVLQRLPLSRFLRDETCKSNLTYLSQASSNVSDPQRIQLAMCQLVLYLLRDPDVEYYCRPQLAGFVDDFLAEIENAELLQLEQESRVKNPQLRG